MYSRATDLGFTLRDEGRLGCVVLSTLSDVSMETTENLLTIAARMRIFESRSDQSFGRSYGKQQ